MRKYVMIVTEEDGKDSLTIESINDGFNAYELLGILENKRHDILEQIYNPDQFERFVRYNKSGVIEVRRMEDEE